MLPIYSDRERAWDAAAAERRIRAWAGAEDAPNAKYAKAFLWKAEGAENFGDYKFPIADVIDGKLMAIPRAIFAARQRLDSAKISPEDKSRLESALKSYYEKMRMMFKDESLMYEASGAILELGDIIIEATGTGNEVEVTVIKAGFGNPVNNHFYGADILRESVEQFVGVNMYADHEIDHQAQRKRAGVRSVRDLVGVIREAWWDEASQSVKARATILREWVMEILRVDPTVMHVSINGVGNSKPGQISGRKANIVESIRVIKSVDLVSHGGAGGKIDRILESLQEEASMALESVTLEDIKEHRPDLLEAYATELSEAAGPEESEDSVSAEEHAAALQEAAATAAQETEERLKAEHALELQRRDNALIVAEVLEAEDVRDDLPEKSRRAIAASFAEVTFEEAQGEDGEAIAPEAQLREALQAAIKEKREELAEALGSGQIKGMGGGDQTGHTSAPKALPKHASVLAQIAPDFMSGDDN